MGEADLMARDLFILMAMLGSLVCAVGIIVYTAGGSGHALMGAALGGIVGAGGWFGLWGNFRK